jgi:hypothetical protein
VFFELLSEGNGFVPGGLPSRVGTRAARVSWRSAVGQVGARVETTS